MFSQLSLLNVSSSDKSEDFNLKDIQVLVGKDVGNFLEIDDIRTSLNGLEKFKMLTRQKFEPAGAIHLVGLDPKTRKTSRISFYLSMVLVIKSSTLEKTNVKCLRSTS